MLVRASSTVKKVVRRESESPNLKSSQRVMGNVKSRHVSNQIIRKGSKARKKTVAALAMEGLQLSTSLRGQSCSKFPRESFESRWSSYSVDELEQWHDFSRKDAGNQQVQEAVFKEDALSLKGGKGVRNRLNHKSQQLSMSLKAVRQHLGESGSLWPTKSSSVKVNAVSNADDDDDHTFTDIKVCYHNVSEDPGVHDPLPEGEGGSRKDSAATTVSGCSSSMSSLPTTSSMDDCHHNHCQQAGHRRSSQEEGHKASKGSCFSNMSSSSSVSTSSSSTASSSKQPSPSLAVAPAKLDEDQLLLIQTTWKVVIHDVSNMCLNFFLDLTRLFPAIRRKISRVQSLHPHLGGGSTTAKSFGNPFKAASGGGGLQPSSPRVSAESTKTNKMSKVKGGDLGPGQGQKSPAKDNRANSELAYHALKFAWAVDALVGALVEGFRSEVNPRTRSMLEKIGDELFLYFGVNSFTDNQLKLMSASFLHCLRLVVVHNGKAGVSAAMAMALDNVNEASIPAAGMQNAITPNSTASAAAVPGPTASFGWSQRMEAAWTSLFFTLIFYMDGSSDDW